MELCTRCLQGEPEENKLLREIAYSRGRSIIEMLAGMSQGMYSSVKEKRLKQKRGKLEEYEKELKQYEESLSYDIIDSILRGESIDDIAERITQDKTRRELEQNIRPLKWTPERIDYKDVEHALEEYVQQGYIEIEEGKIRITAKGAGILAKHALKRILESLAKKEMGPHSIEETGYGPELSIFSRSYEPGDKYELVNIEKTLLHSLERTGKISLKPEDFQVHEALHQTKLCAGLIIDESGSMRHDHKVDAAIDTSLGLFELIRRGPRDSLRVFIFSENVKEIAPWDIVNTTFSGGFTDIKIAMYAFRKSVVNEKGDKQAYLITDTEPNFENGVYIGFNKAIRGVLEEASRYRQENITLNIIMLDQTPYLKAFASVLAKRNVGRVFFTTPKDLGKVIIEDYLCAKGGRVYRGLA